MIYHNDEIKFNSFWFTDEYLKKTRKDLCMHLRKIDSNIWDYILGYFDHYKIPINPSISSKNQNQPYAVEYIVYWIKIIIDTYSPVINDLDMDPLDYITEQLKRNQKIFQDIQNNNKNKIEDIKKSKENLIDTIEQDSKVAMQSA